MDYLVDNIQADCWMPWVLYSVDTGVSAKRRYEKIWEEARNNAVKWVVNYNRVTHKETPYAYYDKEDKYHPVPQREPNYYFGSVSYPPLYDPQLERFAKKLVHIFEQLFLDGDCIEPKGDWSAALRPIGEAINNFNNMVKVAERAVKIAKEGGYALKMGYIESAWRYIDDWR